MLEIVLKSMIPDTSQGPTLQMGIFKINRFSTVMLTLFYPGPFGSVPQEGSENCRLHLIFV